MLSARFQNPRYFGIELGIVGGRRKQPVSDTAGISVVVRKLIGQFVSYRFCCWDVFGAVAENLKTE